MTEEEQKLIISLERRRIEAESRAVVAAAVETALLDALRKGKLRGVDVEEFAGMICDKVAAHVHEQNEGLKAFHALKAGGAVS